MKRFRITSLFVVLTGVLGGLAAGREAGKDRRSPESNALALVGARIYPSPAEEPISNGTILIRDSKIVAVGRAGEIKVSPETPKIDCTGMTIVAGLWNCHVHFTERWADAGSLPASELTQRLQEMLTRYGFTTVFDTGSSWEVTSAIRSRIESGAVKGPRIFSTGEIIFPKGASGPTDRQKGSEAIRRMPEVETPQQGIELVRQRLASRTNAIKIYVQTFWDLSIRIPLETVRAMTAEAHKHGKLVMAHPSNSYGLETSIDAGVDILVHTTPQIGQWTDTQIARMKRQNMSLIPTLKLWRFELEKDRAPAEAVRRFQRRGVEQLAAYFRAGGQILFGTDVGYMTDFDPAEEYQQMGLAGMAFKDILASLTTAPAQRFGQSNRIGRLAAGMDADLVVLGGDPRDSITMLTKVRYVLRRGSIIYQAT
jgi:imidazolonepropionase-like amidohydrolase